MILLSTALMPWHPPSGKVSVGNATHKHRPYISGSIMIVLPHYLKGPQLKSTSRIGQQIVFQSHESFHTFKLFCIRMNLRLLEV